MKILKIPEFDLIQFDDIAERDDYVNKKLIEAGFDIDKHFNITKGYNSAGFVFSQK